MTSKQDVTAAAAAAAVAAGEHLVNVAAQYGPDAPETQQTSAYTDRVVDMAESVGCTSADYENARNTR
ncbi:hypothetical protein [Streptomyces sp. NBC_01353]|uniref:hypothetical protein n=1 Tax=Streptomyces sp. NBC_01353 TaxID=2903835 RepID=UPI002E3099C0|nr:hypothetical protein [Streptomyces sp. NBC_01353]